MRARPDRLIVGEVHDAGAIAMIVGLTTGHAGFSTIHGGSCVHGVSRTLQLTRLNGESTDLPGMISDAIDSVVLMKRRPNGPRDVVDIQRLLGWRDNRYHLEAVAVEHLTALGGV